MIAFSYSSRVVLCVLEFPLSEITKKAVTQKPLFFQNYSASVFRKDEIKKCFRFLEVLEILAKYFMKL